MTMLSIPGNQERVFPSAGPCLPPVETARWLPHLKAQVVEAVLRGQLTIGQAKVRYRLSGDELEGWIHAFRRSGQEGLRATRASTRVPKFNPDRYAVAPETHGWMVVDLKERRPAIVETTAMNGLALDAAQFFADTLNLLHRSLQSVLPPGDHRRTFSERSR